MAGRVFVLLSILLTLLSGSDLTKEITTEHAVVDYGLKLSSGQKSRLQERLSDYNRKHKGQIAVIISDDLQHKRIAVRAKELLEEWLKDSKTRDDSVLIMVSSMIRKVRIQTGANARKLLNDAALESILRYRMLFHLHNGDYYRALHNGLKEIIDVLEGRVVFTESTVQKSQKEGIAAYLIEYKEILFFGFFLAILAAFFWIAFDSASKFRWALLISLVLLFLLFIWITDTWLALAILALVVITFLLLYFWPPGGYGLYRGNKELDKTMIDAEIEKNDTDYSVYSDYSISTDSGGGEGDF